MAGRSKSSRSPTRTGGRIVRWIDLGCPIDLDYDPSKIAATSGAAASGAAASSATAKATPLPAGETGRGEGPSPKQRGYGWFLDDNRPILTITEPSAGKNSQFGRILIGMHDYYSGLDEASFRITADFAVDGHAPGENLAAGFQQKTQGVWELKLREPIAALPSGKLTASVKDRQGNETRIERTIRVDSMPK